MTTANGSRVSVSTSPYLHTALADGTTYYYIVTAVNAAGESAASPQTSGVPLAPVAVPGAPAGLAASAGDGQVTLSWNPVAGTVSWGDVAGGVGTPWTWPAGICRLGGVVGGTNEWDGGLSLPQVL